MNKEFHLIEKGDRSNPAVICLHGLLGTARNLYRLLEAIAADQFFALGYDQRGHGHSFHSSTYSIRELSEDVIEFMDQKQIQSAHLVGHSMGARVSLFTAAKFPDRVQSLTMLDAGIHINPDGLEEVRQTIDPLPESFATKAEAEQFFSDWSPSLKLFLMSNLRTRDGKLSWVFDLNGIKNSLFHELKIDQTENWKKVTCPAQVVRGGISQHFRQTEVDEMLKLKPKAIATLVPNAGHWLHVDNFVDTSKAIVGFLNRVRNGELS